MLRRFTATFISFAGLLSPVFSSIISWFVLGESLNLILIISTFVIASGLWVIYREELRLGYIVKKNSLVEKTWQAFAVTKIWTWDLNIISVALWTNWAITAHDLWRLGDSNSWPSECKPDALPTELNPQKIIPTRYIKIAFRANLFTLPLHFYLEEKEMLLIQFRLIKIILLYIGQKIFLIYKIRNLYI